MSWKSIVDVNLDTKSNPGMCLAFAEDAVGAPHWYGVAREAWDNASDKHADTNLPDAVVAVFWSWVGDLGEGPLDYGHVCINVPGRGLFSSPKRWSDGYGSAWYGSIDEVSRWLGASYLGWTTDLAGLQLAAWSDDVAPEPTPTPSGNTITVEPWPAQNSTLWGISETAFGTGSRWQEIYAANVGTIGSDPGLIQPGMILTIPGA